MTKGITETISQEGRALTDVIIALGDAKTKKKRIVGTLRLKVPVPQGDTYRLPNNWKDKSFFCPLRIRNPRISVTDHDSVSVSYLIDAPYGGAVFSFSFDQGWRISPDRDSPYIYNHPLGFPQGTEVQIALR